MSQKEENKRHGARSNKKLKILYLAKIFLDNTDANHDITLQEIIDKLLANNVKDIITNIHFITRSVEDRVFPYAERNPE